MNKKVVVFAVGAGVALVLGWMLVAQRLSQRADERAPSLPSSLAVARPTPLPLPATSAPVEDAEVAPAPKAALPDEADLPAAVRQGGVFGLPVEGIALAFPPTSADHRWAVKRSADGASVVVTSRKAKWRLTFGVESDRVATVDVEYPPETPFSATATTWTELFGESGAVNALGERFFGDSPDKAQPRGTIRDKFGREYAYEAEIGKTLEEGARRMRIRLGAE